MKYLSEKLNKPFDTVEELEKAEKEFDEQQAEKAKLADVKKARAKEVENAFAELQKVKEEALQQIADAEDKYYSLRDKFAEDYGGYHITYTNDNGEKRITFDDIVRNFWNW